MTSTSLVALPQDKLENTGKIFCRGIDIPLTVNKLWTCKRRFSPIQPAAKDFYSQDFIMSVTATAPHHCGYGATGCVSNRALEPIRDAIPRVRDVANPLERLVQIMHANDRLMDELATIRRRIVRARDYLDSLGCNKRFAVENLAYCKNKHRGVLAQLRANRIEAYQILGLGGRKDAS